MFTCSRCKSQFNDQPASVNATGKYCRPCVEFIAAKSHASRLLNSGQRGDACIWCGKPISDLMPAVLRGPSGHNKGNHVHEECDQRREWLLACVQASPHAAAYVARIEQREAPLREERKRLEEAQQELALAQPKPTTGSNGYDLRLSKIEDMLAKLTAAVGA